ncbi:MAG: hypothetical protein M3340_06015, partial [Actinomycetota bacterium]|nr:hypothetical protein [Actinomycetota bacterium]
TVVATWGEDPDRDGRTDRVVFASGPAGGALKRRGNAFDRIPGAAGAGQLLTDLTRDDRIVWTWGTTRPAGDGADRASLWSVTSAPFARPPTSAPLETATRTVRDDEETWEVVLTAPSGAQVAAGQTRPDGRLVLLARRPGARFKRRTLDMTTGAANWLRGAMNATGDSVFAWEADGDVYALMRRRHGKVVGPRLLTPGDDPLRNDRPAVAIDGAGRALVTWVSWGFDWDSAQGQVRAASSNRAGAFGRHAVISGPSVRNDRSSFPDPWANERGEAAIVWQRSEPGLPVLLVRGRLDR